MSEIQLNLKTPNQNVNQETVETSGTIACNSTNTPSPLFNAAASETAGSIASNSPAPSNSGGTNFVC